MKKLISIVVPVFNEEEIIQNTIDFLNETVSEWSYEHEIIYVNDGSDDNTQNILKKASQINPNIKVINFSRNFGHQMAFTAGLDYSQGNAVIVIDGDLQDPPEVMSEFIKKWENGYQIVYGRRISRKGETFFKLFSANIYYRLMEKLSDIKIPRDVGDFRLMDRKVVDKLKAMREKHRFIRGMVSWVGFKHTSIDYIRQERMAGETKFPLKKMIKFAADGIYSFSIVPLSITVRLGLIITIISFIFSLYLLYRWSVGVTVSGYPSIMLSILFFGGVQLLAIGTLGQYIGRVFEEVKDRPLYIIKSTLNIEK